MTENFEFKLLATDGKARRGEVSMPRGTIRFAAHWAPGIPVRMGEAMGA